MRGRNCNIEAGLHLHLDAWRKPAQRSTLGPASLLYAPDGNCLPEPDMELT